MANGPFSINVLACIQNVGTRVPGDFEDDLPDLFFDDDDFAETAIYTPKGGGQQVACLGMFDDEFSTVDPDSEVEISTSEPTFTLPTKTLEDTLTRGGQFSICNILYKVLDLQPDGSGVTVVTLTKDIPN